MPISPKFYREVWKHIKPGGYFELQEYEAVIRSDDDTINQTGTAIKEWKGLLNEASLKFGKKVNFAELQKQYLINIGVEDVRDDSCKVCSIQSYPRLKGHRWPC